MSGAAHPTGSSQLRGEATELLQALLRLDTVNPPGNETVAAELIRDRLAGDGIECTLVGRAPHRLNLVARLPGGDGPSLILTGHTDTVVADPGEWSRDPWCGDLVDGEVWGRGALDMKSHVAAAVVAFASLAREGARLPGDLVLVVVADEEVGDDYGMSWLVREHPDLVRADFALNEGGGDRLVLGGRPFYLCSVGEKMTAPFRLHLRGRSGHASDPFAADNALLKAGPVLEALAHIEPARELIPEVASFLEVVLGEVPPLEEALARAAALDPLAADLIRPLLCATLSPTMIDASVQRNVIPARCTIEVDCRMLPGASTAAMEALLRAGLPGEWELEWIERELVGGTRSPLTTPLWRSLASWVEETDPEAALAPICGAGFTDSHYLRQSLGTVAYGLFPLRAMASELAARLVHSADERVAVDDLELAVDAFRHAALTIGV